MAEACDIEAEVTAVLVINTRGFRKSITQCVVKKGRVIAVQSNERKTVTWVETAAGDEGETPVGNDGLSRTFSAE